MASHLGVIAHNAIVSDDAIMREMAIGHDQAITPNDGLFPVYRAAVDGDKFTDGGVITDDHLRILTLELKILWNGGNNSPRKYAAILTNTGSFHYRHIRPDPRAIADLNILVDNSKRIHLYIGCEAGIWVNISMGMNHLIKVSRNMAGRGVAKVIVNAKQRIFFRMGYFKVEL